jgi:hypothetical protein
MNANAFRNSLAGLILVGALALLSSRCDVFASEVAAPL